MSIRLDTENKSNSLSTPIWIRNPALTQLLGLSPLLAISSTATKGIALGLISAVICLSAVSINMLVHTKVRPAWRFVWYLFLTSSLTTAIDLSLQIIRLPLHGELSYYLPLLACNFAILAHLESRNTVLKGTTRSRSLAPSLFYCAGIIFALALFSGFRELLIFGSIFRDWSLLTAIANSNADNTAYSSSQQLIPFAALQPGAFIALGLFLAAKKLIDKRLNLKDSKFPASTEVVERARVTGKI